MKPKGRKDKMEGSGKQKKVTEIKTFPVLHALGEIKENIVINTNSPSKEEIINQAFKFHSQGNISEATKYYQYFIDQGFKDHRVFSNYGVILKNLGKLQDAELSYRKAIELNPDAADEHYNLGLVLKDLGKIEEAKVEEKRGIDMNFIQNIDSKYKEACLKNLSLSTSQFRQDLFALSQLNFKKNGFFVEFGSCDGLVGSNSYILEKFFNWDGILAEPAIFWHTKLKENRSVNIETKCVWKSSGNEVLFNEPDTYQQMASINMFSDKNKKYFKEGNRYKVKTISLLDLLETNQAPKTIDYLSIDTEGSEYEILKAFDFDKYKFRVITCEHNFTSRREKIYDLLISKGYQRKLTNISRVDDWYIFAK